MNDIRVSLRELLSNGRCAALKQNHGSIWRVRVRSAEHELAARDGFTRVLQMRLPKRLAPLDVGAIGLIEQEVVHEIRLWTLDSGLKRYTPVRPSPHLISHQRAP